MKKNLGLFAALMLLFGGIAFAEEAMLIDFTYLDADGGGDDESGPLYNKRTVMDFSESAGTTFTEMQKDLMRTSLSLPEWEVVLNASARNVSSVALSQVVAAPVKEDADLPFAGKNVMGVRIIFPDWNVNSNARIVPPFEIPAYQALGEMNEETGVREPLEQGADKSEYNTAENPSFDGTLFEGGYGLVKNVGTLKAISVTTLGMNFPHALYVLLKDTDGVERRYYMGNLGFDGWKELRWNNPQYITEVRTRECRVYPIYPRGLPFVKFVGFQIARDASHVGGNFIGYFKDVKIIYDKAMLVTERDIADEDLWGIVWKQESARLNAEMEKFGNKQFDRYLEKAKMSTEEEFTSSLVAGNNEEDSDQDAEETTEEEPTPVEETEEEPAADDE